MKIAIKLKGTTKTGEEIEEIVHSNVTSLRGQNKAMKHQHRKFWKRHPELSSTQAFFESDTLYA